MYSSACQIFLEKMERMSFRALMIALGAFKTTPTSSLFVESKETTIHLKYDKLSLTYWVGLKWEF